MVEASGQRKIFEVKNVNGCQARCYKNKACNAFSFYAEPNLCILLEECIPNYEPNVISGQRDCGKGMLFDYDIVGI